jgi:putative transposase
MLDTVPMSKIADKSKRNVYSSCQYHIVWCPKYRRKVLSEQRADRLKHIIVEVCQEHQALY